jgi:hypothetical protein
MRPILVPCLRSAPNAFLLLAVLAVVGCKKPVPPPQPEPEPVPLHPDLICPTGTEATGAPPPAGREVWCNKALPTGKSMKQGPMITWHSNEQKASSGEFNADRESGPWLYWYPTGLPEMQGTFTSGVKNGVWTTFHPNGDRQSEGEYVDGREHGAWVYWTEQLTRIEGVWVLGLRDAIWLDYSPEDVAVRERVYRSGRLVSQREL